MHSEISEISNYDTTLYPLPAVMHSRFDTTIAESLGCC